MKPALVLIYEEKWDLKMNKYRNNSRETIFDSKSHYERHLKTSTPSEYSRSIVEKKMLKTEYQEEKPKAHIYKIRIQNESK